MYRSPSVIGCFALLFAVIPQLARAADPILSFVKSPATGKHISLQPQEDHHRVFALVRVQNGGGREFKAELSSNADGETVTNSVNFTSLKNDQTWAICLRTPKKLKETAQYTLAIIPRQDGRETVSNELLYGWTIARTGDGSAKIDIIQPGTTGEIAYTVRKPVEDRRGSTIEWHLVPEKRVKTLNVPPGFVFGVDNNARPVLISAEAIN